MNLGDLALTLGTIVVARVTMELEDSSRAVEAVLKRVNRKANP